MATVEFDVPSKGLDIAGEKGYGNGNRWTKEEKERATDKAITREQLTKIAITGVQLQFDIGSAMKPRETLKTPKRRLRLVTSDFCASDTHSFAPRGKRVQSVGDHVDGEVVLDGEGEFVDDFTSAWADHGGA